MGGSIKHTASGARKAWGGHKVELALLLGLETLISDVPLLAALLMGDQIQALPS